MLDALIIAVAVALLGGLLYYENNGSRTGKLLTKTPLSVLFILAAVVQPHPDPVYYRFIIVALILCLGGDVFLALEGDRTFMFGLVSFLLGHVLYVFAFLHLAGFGQWGWAGPVTVAAVSVLVYAWLFTRLGSMKIPVAAYVVVISFMVAAAWAVFRKPGLPPTGAFLIFLGALLFYLSDLFVARDRFVRNEFLNRRFGLPMYYAGQFLLAFSVGLVPKIN